ncbi:Hypothetical protein CAP_8883 [Chondromyces apiculatus DSM 436]|uniref:Uncharacterized protein n=1 Tax=Chondromyces apiculatus DSM 436 TaxID=1192034 RepID=A0A017SWE3_9BACT|nr:Hypothetical protein CAP_8883 [Chondromyces apiculatus DSM 436]
MLASHASGVVTAGWAPMRGARARGVRALRGWSSSGRSVTCQAS